MTRIVTTHYRYKRPPRKGKAVAIEAPVVVVTTKSSRRPPVRGTEEAAAEVDDANLPSRGEASQPSTPRAAARVASPANDDRKPAIVTTTSKKRRIGDGPPPQMELPLSRQPVEHGGDDYKRLKAAMARRLRGADE
jgi:hypothetical protein